MRTFNFFHSVCRDQGILLGRCTMFVLNGVDSDPTKCISRYPFMHDFHLSAEISQVIQQACLASKYPRSHSSLAYLILNSLHQHPLLIPVVFSLLCRALAYVLATFDPESSSSQPFPATSSCFVGHHQDGIGAQ